MREPSFSKKLTASVCTAALALSMPMMAYAANDGEAADSQEPAPISATDKAADPKAADPKVGTEVPEYDSGNLVQNIEVTGPTSEFNDLTGNTTNISASVTASTEIKNADDNQGAVNEAFTGKDAAAPIIESSNKTSDAYDKALANKEIKAEDVIQTQSFTVKASGTDAAKKGEGAQAAVTVVYTVNKNAEDVKAVAYISIYNPDGTVTVQKRDLSYTAGTGKFDNLTIQLYDGEYADVTIAISNGNTNVEFAGGTGATKATGINDGVYDLQSATLQQYKGNGQLNWSATATGQANAVDEKTAIKALKMVNLTTNPDNFDKEAKSVRSKFISPDPILFTVKADSANGFTGEGSVAVDLPSYKGTKAIVYIEYKAEDGSTEWERIETSVNKDGQIIVPTYGADADYAIALLDESVPTPGEDITPPADDPTNPDNPAVNPGTTDENNGAAGEGTEAGTSKDKANGVKAADNGKTSPKTGVIL